LPEPEDAEGLLRELFGRAEGLFYTIADAAVSSSDTVAASATAKQSNDWLSGITNYMETVLKVLFSDSPNSSIFDLVFSVREIETVI